MRAAGDKTETKSHRRRKPPAAVHGLLVVALAVVLALALSTGSSANSAQAGASASSAAAATEVIALRAKANNKYVTANAGTSPLIANRTSAGTWEKFDLVRINSTDVYLRAHANGKYVSAEAAGAAALISNRAAAGPWEKFQLINNSDGTKSLRARVNNKLVVAESAGAAPLIANRTAIGPWEKFVVVKVSSGTPPTTSTPTSSSTPTPTSGGVVVLGRRFPSATTTGVPSGTPLTTYTGPCSIQTNNAVIDAKVVNCDLRILAQGIKITRSIINGTIYSDPDYFNGSFRLTDSEVRMPPETGTGIGEANFVVTRVEVTGGSRSVNCAINCTVQDSYLHGQYTDHRGIDHESGIRMGTNSVIRNNHITCDATPVPPDAGCSAAITGYGDFAIVQKNTVDNNLIDGGPYGSMGYCAYGGSTTGKPFSAGVNNIKFTNNIFRRGPKGKCGIWGPIVAFDSRAPGNVWTNNLWDDGATVPPAN